MVSPEPSLLQAEQPQLSQSVLPGEVLQLSDHLCSPPLDSLQKAHILLMVGVPEVNTVHLSLKQAFRRSQINYVLKITYFCNTGCMSNLEDHLRGITSTHLKLDEIYPTLKVS